jgi:hypothetical protein
MFRSRPNGSIQAVVETLDRLSATAVRYGPGGKHVLMPNLKWCQALDLLFGSSEIKFMSEPLGPALKQRPNKCPATTRKAGRLR